MHAVFPFYARKSSFLPQIPPVYGGKNARKNSDVCDTPNNTEMDKPVSTDPVTLTRREHDVLKQLARGQTTNDIAETLELSPETVLWYRKRLHRKFEVNSAVALVLKASKMNLI